jgi:hypothetical protein
MSDHDTERAKWERYQQQMEALGLDPREPLVGEEDPRFDAVEAILAEYGGTAPLPPNWEGLRPWDCNGTLAGVESWLEREWRETVRRQIFPGAGETSLAHLNAVIRNAYRVFAYLQIVDPPQREARATTIRVAEERLTNLLFFVRRKCKDYHAPQAEPPKQGTILIERWRDLAVGIDDDWGYYAFSPCPDYGARVTLKDAFVLPLKGTRWKKVLPCLARSADGKTGEKSELVLELGYCKKGNISEDRAKADLLEETKKASNVLKNTMGDLGRELRDCVQITDKTTVFQSNGSIYKAAFTTRHLLRNSDGNIVFGKVD